MKTAGKTAQHTPGPWKADGLIFDAQGRVIADPWVSQVAKQVKPSVEEQDANANLISTAPDGYALAQHILALETDPYLQGHPEWEAFLNEAQALVKKAGGQ